MAYDLQITANAEEDLESILTYLLKTLDNIGAALQLLDEINEKYEKLKQNPYVYESCREPRLKMLLLRKIVIHGYLMIYRIDEKTERVYIERFFSQLQNYIEKL